MMKAARSAHKHASQFAGITKDDSARGIWSGLIFNFQSCRSTTFLTYTTGKQYGGGIRALKSLLLLAIHFYLLHARLLWIPPYV
jgi:hypothetical protein